MSPRVHRRGKTVNTPQLLTKRTKRVCSDTELHSRTKHIDRRHFFIRECVENMQLRVPYVKSIDNLADFFTKPLAKNDYFRMRDVLMNVPVPDRVPVSRNRVPLVRGGV